MILDSKLSGAPVTVEGSQAIARYREWAKTSHGFDASFIALHEASHAVTSIVLDATVRFTEIVSRIRKDGLYAGYTEVETNNDTRHQKFKMAIVAAAPIVLNAQLAIPDGDRMIEDDEKNIDAIGAELAAANSLFMPPADFPRHILQWTRAIVPGNIEAILETARQLDMKKRLLGEEVRAIVASQQRPDLPAIVQAACGLVTGRQAEQIVQSYNDNGRYRAALRELHTREPLGAGANQSAPPQLPR